MTLHRSSVAVRLAVASAVAIAMGTAGLVASGQGRGLLVPRIQRPAGPPYTRADAELIAQRLYRAAFGRDADPTGLSVTAADVQRGNLRSAVDTLFGSTEFRTSQQSKAPAVLLEQFYRGLLNRAPDTSGVQAFLSRVERRQYAGVVVEMIESPEFRAILASPPPVTPAPTPPTRLERALECQTRVLQAVHRDAGGRVFLSFDRLPDESADGQSLQGPAVDRFNDRDRQMTYRCAGQDVTYAYADRNPPEAADARLEFPSAAVRACQNAVRAGLIFDAAALSASDTNAEYVLGLAGGASHQCQMNGTRVVSVK